MARSAAGRQGGKRRAKELGPDRTLCWFNRSCVSAGSVPASAMMAAGMRPDTLPLTPLYSPSFLPSLSPEKHTVGCWCNGGKERRRQASPGGCLSAVCLRAREGSGHAIRTSGRACLRVAAQINGLGSKRAQVQVGRRVSTRAEVQASRLAPARRPCTNPWALDLLMQRAALETVSPLTLLC